MEAVRQSGETNMMDRPRVIELAEIMGFPATAAWIREHLADYAHLLFEGVVIEEDGLAWANRCHIRRWS
jgi:hypothetical protein